MSTESSLELDVILQEMENSCSFSLGRELMRRNVPSFDPLVIRRDHALISEALEATVRFGEMPFGGITDQTMMLEGARRQRILTAAELNNEVRLIQGIRAIKSYEKNLESDHPYIHDLVSTMVVHDHCEAKLTQCISPYGEVLDDASAELRTIRRNLRNADAVIASAVNHFLSTHASSVVDGIVTYRGGRAMVLVRAAEKNNFGGMVYGDSASGQASYVEPASLLNANNRKQELLAREAEEVQRILEECSYEVSLVAEEELANLETCAILDCLYAKALWGKQRDAVVAELTEDRRLIIEKGRHPLIERSKVVANTYHLEDPKHLLLITGPNTGGKTVSMKIIGLFVLMTYCGMPVTAEHAVIPYFDHVFVDIGDDQSVVSSLSSFSAQIVKIAEVMRDATERSLALLDEIGSGTDPREGEALAISVLNELRKRECMTVATTHYGRLKAYGKRHDDILTASVEFDMEKLQPTFRYMEGTTGQSNAFEVAQRYGLPNGIIKYARFLKDQARTQEDKLIEQLETQVAENRQLKEQLEQEQQELDARKKETEELLNRLEQEKDQWKAKAEAEINAYRQNAYEEADEILREMREMQSNAKYHEVLAVRQKLNRKEEIKPQSSEPLRDDRGFAVGDVVELRVNNQVARITAIRRKDITIELNGRQMHVKEDQIRHSLRILPEKKKEAFVKFGGNVLTQTMSPECNLIGMRVDEAMEELSDYLDSAKMNNLLTFRIIHGDGTGALRKAVHNKLDRDRDVDSYRLGMPNEGGTGATVVTLKG
ncbi:MAG: Smr/MutS family protein [Erysipelotrichaceae bacterium]|nr:Smr/MutS family protein [Erysipelotrichaceae bacterium]